MVDTNRDKAALATLFADNASGAISEQDLRDFLESMHPSAGSLYFTTPAATTIAVAGTYVKAAGTTTSVNLHRFTMPASNRLTYTGAPDIDAHIACSVSMTSAGTNIIAGLKIAKNDTVLDDSVVRRKIATGSDIGAAALFADTSLSTNDYLELWVTNETNTSSMTIDNAYLFGLEMFK